jgi:leucyl aminopeptidase
MPVTTTNQPLTEMAADAVVVGLFAEMPPGGPAAEFDRASGGLLSKLIESKEVTGKKNEIVTLLSPPGVKATVVVVAGLGPRDALDRGAAYRAAAAAAKALAGKQRGRVAFYLADHWAADLIEAGVCGSIAGCVGQDLYRAKKNRFPIADVAWATSDAKAAGGGAILGEAVNLTRRLVNEPPSEIFPESFAAEAVKVAEANGMAVEVWDRSRLEAERCGSLLAVANGSDREPRLVILRYSGGAAGAAPLALVGKGVTFDSGGLSIKPTDGMKTMKCDMAGAATVLGAMQAIAQLKLPVNVVGLCGLVENMLSGSSYKLGDVLKARSGKTIEVLNTDAEGRLVLADALAYACKDIGATHIVDLATLTGGVVIALGHFCAGVFCNDAPLLQRVNTAAESSGEKVWQLPLWKDHKEFMRSQHADILNSNAARSAHPIQGAAFLAYFVDEKIPWAHIDIAGMSNVDSDKDLFMAGPTGYGVRLLIDLMRGFAR